MEPRQFKFMIECLEAASTHSLGVIGLNPHGMVGYQLDPTAWGKGYATEALNAYLLVLFKNFPDLEEVYADAIESNIGSRRVLEKCGFVLNNQIPGSEHRKVGNVENDTVYDESRENKLRELRIMLERIGLQASVNAPPTKENRNMVMYRYDRPRAEV